MEPWGIFSIIAILGVTGFVLYNFDAWFGEKPKTKRETDLEEIKALYDSVAHTQFPDVKEILDTTHDFSNHLYPTIGKAFHACIYELVEMERFDIDRPAFEYLDFRELAALKAQLYLWQKKSDRGQKVFEELVYGIVLDLFAILPETESPSPFTVPFIYTYPDAKVWIQRLAKTVVDREYRGLGLFQKLNEQLYRNVCKVSGIVPFEESKKEIIPPTQNKLPLMELNRAYLGNTPFERLFAAPVPLRLTHEDRFNHMHIIGGTGAGKTTLIENLIMHDLQSDDPPSIVLIDPHGDLIKRLTSADLGLGNRLIVIDPRDVEYPPALNIFAMNQERMRGYDRATQEQVTAGVIQTFDYLFAGITDLALTGKQETFFRYVARLMLKLPEAMGRNATILDMLNLMGNPAPYEDAINALPPIPRDFFKTDFMGPTFKQTKEQIRYRLQAIIENPTMARLFTSPETKIDLFSEINRGSIILVDTAKDFLKGNSATFGRLFISLTLQAVLERAAIPEGKRKSTFLFIDEAASFFDSNIDDLLTEARKYKCGVVLSHQYLDQASSSLRASLNANTGIKFAGATSASDARAMASEMRTTADFILEQPKLQFAAYIKNVTPQAISVPITFSKARRQLSGHELDRQQERNRERVSLGPDHPEVADERPQKPKATPRHQKAAPQPASIVPPPKPYKAKHDNDDDISKEW